MEVTLLEILDSREKRVKVQKRILEHNPYPLICFTMNIAGPVKTSPTIVRAFKFGLAELEKKLKGCTVPIRRIDYAKCGPTSYYSVKGSAAKIKEICVDIEESCPLGRLFDMDVLDTDGKKLERKLERRCIICGAPGKGCSAGRIHSVSELQKETERIISEHFEGYKHR